MQIIRLFLPMLVLTTAPALAESPAGGKHNAKAPVEINADTLEVLQQENKAIFSGHVVAIQGEVRLQSDKMTVHYRKPAEDGKKEEKKLADSAPIAANTPNNGAPGGDAIEKIDVEGNVFITTPEETAAGKRGDYDVKNQEIHLYDNVVLTRGKNVLKGDQLTYNFASGKSVISGGANAVAGQNGGQNAKPARVRALFVPEDKDAAKK